MGRVTIKPVVNASTSNQEMLPLASGTTIEVSVFVNKKNFFYGSTLQEYRYTITGGSLAAVYSEVLFTLEHWVALSVNQYGAPHYMVFSPGLRTQDHIMVAGSARALYHFLEQVVQDRSSIANTLIINDNIKSYAYTSCFKGGLEYLPTIFSEIQPGYLSNLTRLEISIVPNVANILKGIASLFRRGCLPQIKHIALPFSVKSQPNVYHPKGKKIGLPILVNFCMPAVRDILALERFYKVIADKTKSASLQQLEHVRFTLQTKQVTTAALEGLGALYPQLKTLIIDAAMPTAIEKLVVDHYENYWVPTGVAYGPDGNTAQDGYWEKRPVYAKLLHMPLGNDLLALDKIVKANVANNRLESLEVYRWIPGNDFPIFVQGRLTKYISKGYLPHLKKISMCPPIGHSFSDDYLLNTETALDTSDLLEATLMQSERIEELQLLLPEKNGYQKWLLQILGKRFPNLTHLSYRLPDKHKDEDDIKYESRLEHAILTLIAIAGLPTKIKICRIEGNFNMLTTFKDKIAMIDKCITERIARRQENIE